MPLYADTIYMKKGDRLPSITYILRSATGIQDLSAASGVVFKFELADGSGSPISGNCAIEDTTAGRVRYDWGASDTATAGIYNAEFVATFSGREMTFPNGDGRQFPQFLKLVIADDVA